MKLESVSLAVHLVGMASTVVRNAVNNAMGPPAKETMACVLSGVSRATQALDV